jgi:hypothetical protein
MNIKRIEVDDFFPAHQVEEIHSNLINSGTFQHESYMGDSSPGICKQFAPENVSQLLAQAHGVEKPVDIKVQFYRLALLGEEDDSFCHADTYWPADWAAVVYLTKGIRSGGTAFWRNMQFGIDEVPDWNLLNVAGFDPALWQQTMSQQVRDQRQWQLVGFSGFKFNRLVTYPTKLFHSRSPNRIEAPFGHEKSNGRLIWVAFYNL